MTEHQGLWSRRVGLLLVAALLALAPGPANGQSRSAYARMERETLVKELGLTPEQATAFQAVGDKFDQTRAGIIAGIKSKEGDLEKALAAAKPDEAKLKELVAAITQGHDQLFQTLRTQRQEEMALLNPVQQGKFILCLKKWHEESSGNPGK
jgi:Spy/CpxP family protein refolding chaperone